MSKIVQKITLMLCIVLTMLVVGLFVVINFSPIGVAGLKNIASGAEILDFQLGFSLPTALDILSNLGETGRAFYLRLVIPLDFAFPLAYGLCALGWVALLLKNTKAKHTYYPVLLLPIAAMLADWSENIGIITLLRTYPNLSAPIVTFASVSGIVKWAASGLSILTIVILLVLMFTKKFRSKGNGIQ